MILPRLATRRPSSLSRWLFALALAICAAGMTPSPVEANDSRRWELAAQPESNRYETWLSYVSDGLLPGELVMLHFFQGPRVALATDRDHDSQLLKNLKERAAEYPPLGWLVVIMDQIITACEARDLVRIAMLKYGGCELEMLERRATIDFHIMLDMADIMHSSDPIVGIRGFGLYDHYDDKINLLLAELETGALCSESGEVDMEPQSALCAACFASIASADLNADQLPCTAQSMANGKMTAALIHAQVDWFSFRYHWDDILDTVGEEPEIVVQTVRRSGKPYSYRYRGTNLRAALLDANMAQ